MSNDCILIGVKKGYVHNVFVGTERQCLEMFQSLSESYDPKDDHLVVVQQTRNSFTRCLAELSDEDGEEIEFNDFHVHYQLNGFITISANSKEEAEQVLLEAIEDRETKVGWRTLLFNRGELEVTDVIEI